MGHLPTPGIVVLSTSVQLRHNPPGASVSVVSAICPSHSTFVLCAHELNPLVLSSSPEAEDIGP